MDVINIDGLSKSYRTGWRKPEKLAVSNLSLSIREGEVFGFVGPNGAGKSTTIKMMIGVTQPSAGLIKLLGIPAGDPLSRKGLGYVPENPSLYDHLTPFEILSMGLSLHSVKVADRRRHCMTWLDRFGLAPVAHKRISGFSKGMVQRTTLAHAMAIQPRLLILDEPLSGLDPIGRRDVVELLSEYKHGGGTIFFTSHVLHDVERLADRFGLIDGGVLKTVQSPHQFLDADQRMLVRSSGSRPVQGMAQMADGQWQAEVGKAELWDFLFALKNEGHAVQEVKPAQGLEGIFLSVVENGGAEFLGVRGKEL